MKSKYIKRKKRERRKKVWHEGVEAVELDVAQVNSNLPTTPGFLHVTTSDGRSDSTSGEREREKSERKGKTWNFQQNSWQRPSWATPSFGFLQVEHD